MIGELNFLLVGGAGKIGTAIARGLVDSGKVRPDRILVTARHENTLSPFRSSKIRTSLDNRAAYRDLGRPVVVLCVHPDEVGAAIDSVGGADGFRDCPLIVSVATGVATASIEAMLGAVRLASPIPVVRAMPNLPARIRSAMTVVAAGSNARSGHLEIAREVFETIGRVIVLDEKHLNAVTGLAGCGPAYVFQIVEALAHGGVQVGLPRDAALLLAAQTVKGAAEMILETGTHPAVLKDEVTTPGGCTIAALSKLEMLGLKSALIQAVETATARAAELGRTPPATKT